MKHVNITVSEDMWLRLHNFTHYKGDLERIGTEAFEMWLKLHEAPVAVPSVAVPVV